MLHSTVTGIPIAYDDGAIDEEARANFPESALHDFVGSRDESNTPEISRFLGIVVSMFCNDRGTPHLHASYGSDSVVIEVPSLGVVRGGLPPRGLGFVMEWARTHRDELMQDGELAREGRPLKRIAPLE
jgi:hypothetical protein